MRALVAKQRGWVAALALLAALFPANGWAETRAPADLGPPSAEHPRIVLVTNHADARIIPLLQAELREMGLEVVTVDKGENEVLPDDLIKAARATQAVAAFRVLVAESEVGIWIGDRVTGKIVLREVITQESDAKSEEIEVVLRAVELLRVSLMELEAPHEPRGEVPPPPGLDAVVGFPDSKAKFWVGAGAGVLWFSEDFPIVPSLEIDLGGRLSDWFALGAVATLPFGAAQVEEPEGQAFANPRQMGVHFALAPRMRSLHPIVGLGAGLQWVSLRGRGEPPRESFEEEHLTGSVFGRAALGYFLSPNVRLQASATGGAVVQRALAVISVTDAARTSRAFATGNLGVQLVLP